MLDLLLKFPDKQTAIQLGAALGFTKQDEQGEWNTTTATNELAILVIGEHHYPTGATVEGPFGPQPVMQGDGLWWVMLRALVPMPVPPEADPFIVWRSDAVHEVDGKEVPAPRPVAPEIPSVTWA